MPISEITKSISDRIRHPFLFTFAVSALLHNWPIMLVSFTGDERFGDRVKAVDGYLALQGPEFFYWRLWIDPLFIALAFTLVVVPYGLSFMDMYNKRVDIWRRKKLEGIARDFDDSDGVLAHLMSELATEQMRYIGRIRHQISELKARVRDQQHHLKTTDELQNLDSEMMELSNSLDITRNPNLPSLRGESHRLRRVLAD